ncbi:TesB-like acyl-CoA thioesterase 3, partial [Streptomyces sp. 4F]
YGALAALPDAVRPSANPPAIPPMDQCLGAEDGPTPVDGSSAIADRLMLKLDPATLGWALGQPSGRGE